MIAVYILIVLCARCISPEDRHRVSRSSGTVYVDRGRDNEKYIIISNICL